MTPKVDPLTLAMFLQKHLDELARKLFDNFGTMPSEVYDQYPNELFEVMFRKTTGKGCPIDTVTALRRVNDSRAKKGLRPVIGKLFESAFPGVP